MAHPSSTATRWPALLASLLIATSAAADPAELLAPGRAAAAAGDYRAAIDAADGAIIEAEELSGADRLVVAYLLNDIAGWQFALADPMGALESAREGLLAARAHLAPGDSRLGYFLRDIARYAYASGRCEESIEAYEQVRALVGDDPTLAAAGHDMDVALARVLRAYGDEAGARVLLNGVIEAPAAEAAALATARVELAMLALDRFDTGTATAHLDEAAAVLDDADSARNVGPAIALIAARVWAERAAGRYQRAEALLTDAETRTATLGSTERAPLINERANLEAFRGRFANAERRYRELIDAYAGYSDASMPKAHAYHQLALALREIGDHVQADVYFDRAESGFSACPIGDPWRLALLLNERARLRLELGRVVDAEADAEAMMAIVTRSTEPRPVIRAYALAVLSETRARRGRLAEARDTMSRALESIRETRGPDAEDLAPGLVRLAEWSLALGEVEAARGYADEALELRRRTGATSLWGEAAAWSLVAAAADPGSADYAAAVRGMIASAERYLDMAHGAAELVRQELRASRALVDRALQPTAANRSDDEAIDAVTALVQWPQLAESAAVLGEAGATLGARGRALELLRARTASIQQRRALASQLEALSAGSDLPDTSDAAVLEEMARLDRELETTAIELRRIAPRVAERLVPRTLAAAELQAALEPGEALYMQAVTRTATHGVLVLRDRVVHRIGPPRSGRDLIRRDVRRLRMSLDLQLGPDRAPFDVAAARALYQASLAPFEDDLDGIENLIVVPDDAFQSIPWSLFRIDSEDGDTTGQSYLSERLSVTVVPSASVFAVLRADTERPAARRAFVGFGDPVLAGSSDTRDARSAAMANGFPADTSAELVRGLAPLPQTARELQAISATLGGRSEDLFLRSAATRARLREVELSDYRVLSFATHGLVAGDFRGLSEPALVLTPDGADDGLLRASEIANLRLNAELVLLSACNTGRADDGGGAYGLSALARAFFAAGAQSLVVSHWAVDSEATLLLLTRFIELTTEEGLTKSEALREAMRWMSNGGAGERYQDPAYWAAFVLIGDPGPLTSPADIRA